MEKNVLETPELMGKAAGIRAAESIKNALDRQGYANIILATGTSQFHTLQNLIATPGIDWRRVTMFHLDEYIGIPMTHPRQFPEIPHGTIHHAGTRTKRSSSDRWRERTFGRMSSAG